MKSLRKLAVFLLLPVVAGAAPLMPFGTYLVKCAFKGDYNTVVRDLGTTATVKAQRSDGTVIAKSDIGGSDEEGYNFVLKIPVASASTEKACMVGETLDAVFEAEGETLEVPQALVVKSPTSVGVVTIYWNDVKEYINPSDGTVVEIPTDYIGEAQVYLEDEGMAGEYDPWGDYDGDGASNYAEFLAGTNPFDATDYLRIRGFAAKEGRFALKFEHVGGHVYAVSSSNALANPEWAKRRVRKTSQGDELDQLQVGGVDGDPGETEIYITPAAGATSEFFRLEAK